MSHYSTCDFHCGWQAWIIMLFYHHHQHQNFGPLINSQMFSKQNSIPKLYSPLAQLFRITSSLSPTVSVKCYLFDANWTNLALGFPECVPLTKKIATRTAVKMEMNTIVTTTITIIWVWISSKGRKYIREASWHYQHSRKRQDKKMGERIKVAL